MQKSIFSTLTVLCALLLTLQVLSAKEVVRITKPDSKTVLQLNNAGYDIASQRPGEYIDLVVTEEQKQQLSQSYNLIVTQTEEKLKTNLKGDKEISGYRTYGSMLTELQQLVAQYPNILKLEKLGNSHGFNYAAAGFTNYDTYNQHNIWAVKLSDNVSVEEDEPNYFFMGSQHAREPLGLETCLKILHSLVDNYGTNAAMTERVNSTQIWFLPLINPDGHKIVLDQVDVWHRKNIRDNNNSHTFVPGIGNMFPASDGVDLNRNWSCGWGGASSSNVYADHTYRGPQAFSEPELQAILPVFENRIFQAGIDYHTYSDLVLYPYGYESNIEAPDKVALKALAEEMAATIPRLDGGFYTANASWELYPAGGTSIDYIYSKYGTFAILLEMGTEFIPPAALMNTTASNQLTSVMLLLDRHKKATLTGLLTDSQSGLPIQGTIHIDQIDNNPVYRAPYKSEKKYGRYYRFLQPGSYTVTVSAFGYAPQTINNVIIDSSTPTTLNVSMNKTASYSISGKVQRRYFDEDIANAKIVLLDTPCDTANTSSAGLYQIESIPNGNYNLRISAPGFTSKDTTVVVAGNNAQLNILLLRNNWVTILNEDFENTFPPTGWTNTSSGYTKWQKSGSTAHTGDHCAMAKFSGGKTKILTSNKIILENSAVIDSIKLSFWWYDGDPSKVVGHDTTFCEISSDNGSSWQQLAYLSEPSSSQAFIKQTCDITPYIGKDVYIRWKERNDQSFSAYGCGLDDITITHRIRPDVGPLFIENEILPANNSVITNYPNPFNPVTTIKYTIPVSGDVKLVIYNTAGSIVDTILRGEKKAGTYQCEFNGNGLASGIYFCQLQVGNKKMQVAKMMMVK